MALNPVESRRSERNAELEGIDMTRFAAPLRLLYCTVASVLWAAFATTDAHAAGTTDGLAEAERVLRESGGSDAQDLQRQRFAALVVLQTAARKVSTVAGAKPTPDDIAKVGGYNRALQHVMREVSQTGTPNCVGEDCPAAQLRRSTAELMRNDAFVRGVFERFATPAWRDTHLATLLNRGGAANTATAPPPGAMTLPGAAPLPSAPPAQKAEAPRLTPAAVAPAAGAASGDFSFLAEMPAVERVAAEIIGADALDTKVQQHAAFQMLAMDFMLTQRNAARDVPPRFTELDRAYKAEVLRLDRELRAEVAPPGLPPAEAAQRWAPIFMRLTGYGANAAFRQQLMQRFFSPAWIDTYERKKGQFEQWRASALSNTAVARGDAPGAPAATPRPAPGAAPVAAPAVAATEPPRESRSPSGVDMMVLGVPMGEPLRLPPCPTTVTGTSLLADTIAGMERALSTPKTTCQNRSGTSASGRNDISIKFPPDRCPEWLNILCLTSGVLYNGRLAQLMLGTRGLDVEESVVRILRAKYGKPSSSKRVTWSNDSGGRWEAEELAWDLKDLIVEFRPMVAMRHVGRITITTAEGRRLLDAETKREEARQPRL